MKIDILQGDCREVLKTLPPASVHCCVTSPPYWGLRDYGVAGQVGLEENPSHFIDELVNIFNEVRRVLREDGTLWLNLGDSYNSIGHKKSSSGYGSTGLAGGKAQEHSPLRRENTFPGLKHKDLCGIPWRVAFALQADGWWLREEIIWHKPNPMPEPIKDRCTRAHEYIFHLSKQATYYHDAEAIKEPSVYAPGKTNEVERAKGYYNGKWSGKDKQAGHGRRHAGFNERWERQRNDGSFKAIRETRNKRSVWTVPPKPFKEAHFATFPPDLIEPCVLAGCPWGGTVLDPFGGAGTTGLVAEKNGRNAVLIELNPEYVDIAQRRLFGSPKMPWETT